MHYTETDGYRHNSGIEGGTEALDNLAKQYGFEVTHINESSEILSFDEYDVVIFDNNVTSGGEGILSEENERQALKDYVEGGGSWLGFGAASDYDCEGWEWYHEVLFSGNCFTGSRTGTWTLEVDADLVGDPALSAMWEEAGLEDTVTFDSRKYRFEGSTMNLREDPAVKVLQKVTESDADYDDHYFTWTKPIGKGRMLYTALGIQGSDFTQNDKWLERAAWQWMKYLTGQYGNSLTLRVEGGRLSGLRRAPAGSARGRFYALNGRLVAASPDENRRGMDFFGTAAPGIHVAIFQTSSGVATRNFLSR